MKQGQLMFVTQCNFSVHVLTAFQFAFQWKYLKQIHDQTEVNHIFKTTVTFPVRLF